MNTLRLLLLALVVAAPALAAPVVSIEGLIRRDGAPVTGVFTVTVEVDDDNGDTLIATSLPSLVITDGLISIDLDLADGTDALRDNGVLTIRVDLGDGLTASARLGAVASAASAARALRALSSTEADTLGDAQSTDLLPAGVPVDAPVAFANLTALPEGIADGVDNGTVTGIGSGLVLTAGVLNVATNGVGGITDGTLTGAQIADGTVTGTVLNGLDAAKVANGAVTGANFSTNAFSVSQVGTRQVFRHPPGCETRGILSTEPLCRRRECDVAAFRTCDGTGCSALGQTTGTDLFCSGTAEGHVVVGRLIRD